MTVGFIPARGGSKRLPRKNVRLFAGRPLIAYSIATALESGRLDRCVVSTDDDEIEGVARACGAEVIRRPAELASDTATTVSVAMHVIATLTAKGARPDVLVTFQPTCPLRPASLVVRALDLFCEHQPDSVVSVTESTEKTGHISESRFVPGYPVGIRSQDLPRRYFENGLIYVSRVESVLASGHLFGERAMALIVDRLFALGDIDTDVDFTVAECIYERYRSRFSS